MKITPRQLFVVVLLFGVFLLTFRPVTDPDFWWHLSTGQLIDQSHKIPTTDPYSFTAQGNPWVTHEWLSELLIFKIYQVGSFGLLILLFSIIITAAYFLVYLRCPRASKPYIAGFALLLGAVASAPLWGVRPQMITLLIFSSYLYFLDRFQQDHRLRNLIPLPLIMVVWVNLHGGYILGLGIMGIYIAGNILDIFWHRLAKKASNGESLKPVIAQILCFILTLLAALLNPNGLRILTYPFETLTDPAMQQYIQEWHSPDFRQIIWLPLALFILAIIGSGIKGYRKNSTIQFLLLLVFGYAALRSMRNVPLFAVVAVPILAGQVDAFFKTKMSLGQPIKLFGWVNVILISTLIFGVTARFIQVSGDQTSSEVENFPKPAVDWIIKNQPAGNLFNSYTWGGYLIWKLHPNYPVFIDGRPDMYGPAFFSRYADIYLAKAGWKEALLQDDIRVALIEPTSDLAKSLRQSPDWNISYEDKMSVVFQRR